MNEGGTPAGALWPRYGATDWCLFLDRDGVINRRVEGDYVRSWSQFEWLPGVLGALAQLSDWAPNVVVVTNQQGVGKGLMEPSDVDAIHARMIQQIVASGGRVDDVLVCPHLASVRCRCRKPRSLLAQSWLDGHPHVDPEKCVVVGDSWSDIAMGRVATRGRGTCVWIGAEDQPLPVPRPDAWFGSLVAFTEFIDRCLAERVTA